MIELHTGYVRRTVAPPRLLSKTTNTPTGNKLAAVHVWMICKIQDSPCLTGKNLEFTSDKSDDI